MLSRIPLNRVPHIIEEVEKSVSSTEICGRIQIPLLSPDAGDLVVKAQQDTMLHLNRLMDGGRIIAKMNLMYDEMLISSGITNMQHELKAGLSWLEVATKLLDEATSGESQEIPFFSDPNQARSTEISFSSLNPQDQENVERMIQRAEAVAEKMKKQIEIKMEGTSIELEDDDLDILKSMVPSVRYGVDRSS